MDTTDSTESRNRDTANIQHREGQSEYMRQVSVVSGEEWNVWSHRELRQLATSVYRPANLYGYLKAKLRQRLYLHEQTQQRAETETVPTDCRVKI